MLPLPINPSLMTLPTDLLKVIYNHLPIKDQQFTAPRISKIWRSIAFKVSGESEEINHGLNLSGKEFEMVNIICNTTNFISTIRKTSLWCSIGHGSCAMFSTKFSAENAEGQSMTAQGHHSGYDGCSASFNLIWNPSTLKVTLEGYNWGDYRSSYAIQVNVLNFTYNNFTILRTISPSFVWGGFSVENRHLFSWERAAEETIQPPHMNESIKHALTIQLKMYVKFLTHLNMIFLSKINLENELILECNSTGRIIQALPHDTALKDQHILRITKGRLLGEIPIPYLIWNASDHSSNEEHQCQLQTVLRWCVYSSTTQSLAKKMGLKITEH